MVKKRLKIKNLAGFYKVKYIDVIKHHNGDLLGSGIFVNGKRIHFSLYELLIEAYPSFDWKFWMLSQAPTKIWNKLENRKKFFDWFLKKVKINKSTDEIYNITTPMIAQYGGGRLLTYYKSLPKLLKKLLPNRKIDLKKLRNPPGYWLIYENQRKELLKLGEKLGFKNMKDWYGLKQDDLINNRLAGLYNIYQGSPTKVVTKFLKNLNLIKLSLILHQNMNLEPDVLQNVYLA